MPDNSDWLPGDLVVVLGSTLVTRWSEDENNLSEQFTRGPQLGLIICRSHQWVEPSAMGENGDVFYVVFFSGAPQLSKLAQGTESAYVTQGFYRVPGDLIVHPDEAHNPARLFGSQRLRD